MKQEVKVDRGCCSRWPWKRRWIAPIFVMAVVFLAFYTNQKSIDGLKAAFYGSETTFKVVDVGRWNESTVRSDYPNEDQPKGNSTEIANGTTVPLRSDTNNNNNNAAQQPRNNSSSALINATFQEPLDAVSMNSNNDSHHESPMMNTTDLAIDPFFPIRTTMISVKERNWDSEYNTTLTHGSTKIPPITFMIMLTGEFGNNLLKIVWGLGIALMASEDFGLESRIIFTEQKRKNGVLAKAKKTSAFLSRCIPYLQGVDFTTGNRMLEEGYFTEIDSSNIPRFTLSDLDARKRSQKLKQLRDYLEAHPELHHRNDTEPLRKSEDDDDSSLLIPRVMVRLDVALDSPNLWNVIDLYYESIQKLLRFDDENCCGESLKFPPAKDEIVMHYRNFATEMKQARREVLNFQEMAGAELVDTLFADGKVSHKVAVTGRNLEKDSKRNGTEAYLLMEAFRERNVTVRFSPGTDPMEDFCFLKSAKMEFLGPAKSTFSRMAVVLGGSSMKRSRLYSYISRTKASRNVTYSYHFTHPELSKRIQFESYWFS